MKNKIGVGVITCNAVERFEKCIRSIPKVDALVVVNDGDQYLKEVYPTHPNDPYIIQHSQNKCVGISKNDAMRYLMQQDCDHIFLIEDDMIIQREDVFEKYIKTAEASGIWHLNFGYHGPANMKPGTTEPNPRQIVDYGNGNEVALNPNCVGAFTYFLRGVIKEVGYHDERFKNAWEHVEHTNRIIRKGLHPPFWWFADVANSYEYIKEYASSEVSSVIRKTPEWEKQMREGMEWYKHKHNCYPTQTPDTPPERVMQILENIEKNYAKKVL